MVWLSPCAIQSVSSVPVLASQENRSAISSQGPSLNWMLVVMLVLRAGGWRPRSYGARPRGVTARLALRPAPCPGSFRPPEENDDSASRGRDGPHLGDRA